LPTPGGSFDVAGKEEELAELRLLASEPDLWNDPDRAREVTQKLARYEGTVEKVGTIEGRIDDAEVLLDLAAEEGDAQTAKEAAGEIAALDGDLSLLERESLFFGEYDDRPAILSVHAGAGGVDAQDWAEMLLRMYVRYLERTPFQVEIDEIQPGEEAGIKSATLTIKGDHAYGWFEGERGVHRLVRISPFDSAARRHTSFAGVDVIPEVDLNDVEINPDDLRIDTYRSQGAGGQHVNTSDSAVRITHLPTNTVVACQNERSQLQNKNRAMQILAARLAELARQERLNEIDSIRGEQTEAAWGRQIRSYVLQPYQMVKDLRSEVEVGNVTGVLDGDLDRFVDAYLHWRRAQQQD
jgi:peptide chain release factor 2